MAVVFDDHQRAIGDFIEIRALGESLLFHGMGRRSEGQKYFFTLFAGDIAHDSVCEFIEITDMATVETRVEIGKGTEMNVRVSEGGNDTASLQIDRVAGEILVRQTVAC